MAKNKKVTVTIAGVGSRKFKRSEWKAHTRGESGPVLDFLQPHQAVHASTLRLFATDPSVVVPPMPVVTVDIPKKKRRLVMPGLNDMPVTRAYVRIFKPVYKAMKLKKFLGL